MLILINLTKLSRTASSASAIFWISRRFRIADKPPSVRLQGSLAVRALRVVSLVVPDQVDRKADGDPGAKGLAGERGLRVAFVGDESLVGHHGHVIILAQAQGIAAQIRVPQAAFRDDRRRSCSALRRLPARAGMLVVAAHQSQHRGQGPVLTPGGAATGLGSGSGV